MDLYIDKENLVSFIKAGLGTDKPNGYMDCERLIMRQLSIVYNFTKEDARSDELIMTWLMKLSEGRGPKEVEDKYRSNVFPERPIKTNCYNSFSASQLCAVYLINDDDDKIQSLIDKNALLIGKVGEEVKTLRRLFCGNDYDLDKLYDLHNNFPSWEKLAEDNHFLPLTEIIIVDNYLFHAQEEDLEQNIYKLLKLLVAASKQSKINILFVTQKEYYDKKTRNTIKPNWDKLKDRIVNIVNQQIGAKPNITFILTNNQLKKHDRFILTNYRLFRSGDTFYYFNRKDELKTRGDFFDVNSLAKWSNHQVAKSLIESIQQLYDEVKKNPDSIVGRESKSNFIRLDS